MFAVWRSCQHYASPDSLPDARAATLETILHASPRLPSAGRASRFVARQVNGQWSAMGFVKDGSLVQTTTATQLRKYDKVRGGDMKWSNDSYRALTAADHPQRTVDLDLR
ncbi:hypothetical protein ACWEK5_28895 [Rhodococcus koreensis]